MLIHECFSSSLLSFAQFCASIRSLGPTVLMRGYMQLNDERLQQIEYMIKERQHVRVAELSIHFGVSEPTIRRDLHKLATMGRVKRAHGGAIAAEQVLPEPPIVQRFLEHAEEALYYRRLREDLFCGDRPAM